MRDTRRARGAFLVGSASGFAVSLQDRPDGPMLAFVRSLSFVWALLVLLISLPAHGEGTSLLLRGPSQGLDIPGTSVALEDGPAAAVVNPAGLAMQRGLSLRYLHEDQAGGRDAAGIDGDGLYLGTPLFGWLGFGLSFEWLSPDHQRDHRRTTWSLAIGDEVLSLGASLHVFTHGLLDDTTTWDVGLLFRPSRYVSVGFTLRDLDSDRVDGLRLSRRYAAGLGLRPFGDWLTLAADAEVLGSENKDIDHGFDSMGLAYTARLRALDGLTVIGGYTHRLDGGTDAVYLGLRLDSSFLSVEGMPLVATKSGDMGFWAGAELRTWRERGLHPPRGGTFARVRLDDALASSRGLQIFPGEPRLPILDVVEGLAALGRDDRYAGVVLDVPEALPIGLGTAWDLHRAILELRGSGKTVVAYLGGADDATYLVASAADRIVASPTAAFFVNGMQARADFFEDTLDWIGVHMEVVRVGTYKTAPEALTRDSISDAHREALHSILDDSYSTYVAALARARGVDVAAIEEAISVGIRSPQSANDVGLVDAIAYPDALHGQLEGQVGRRVRMQDHRLAPTPWQHWSSAPVIAVIPVEGTIVAGESEGFGFVPSVGGRTVVRALERAAADPEVRAILLRIDSGGGDAGASELIWRAVAQAQRRKPVIVSMGDAAASGGYYAAASADAIYANPGTITGSIGIFWLKPDFSGLFEKLKVGTYATERGEQAGILSSRRGWTEEERASIQTYVDSFYRSFVEAVAEGRGLDFDEVDRVAQGRVWTGSQAWERGLVDDLGALPAALRAVREAGGLAPDATVRFRVLAPTSALFSSGGLAAFSTPALDGPVQTLLRKTVPIPILLWNDTGLWALAPISWRQP